MAVDDIIKAGRNMAKMTGQMLDNSKTATKALNKIVSDYGTALNNAKKITGSKTATKALNEIVSNQGTALNNARKIVDSNTATKALNEIVNEHGSSLNNARKITKSNTTAKSINNIVQEHGTALDNAKKIANANTSAPSRYDARGNYQQALEKAKEIAGGNTTNKAVNNIKNGPQREVPPIQNPWETSWDEWTDYGNKNFFHSEYLDDAPYSERLINEINNGNTSTGPKYGPRKDSIPNNDGPFQNNFDFSNDSGPKADSSGNGGGNKNANKNTNANSGSNNGPNSGGGNEGPNNRRSWGDYANSYFGGISDTYKGTKAGNGFWNSLESAHKNADGTMRWDRVAGTYAAAALGSRVISGGGLYKDKYGNTNLPGIPFI